MHTRLWFFFFWRILRALPKKKKRRDPFFSLSNPLFFSLSADGEIRLVKKLFSFSDAGHVPDGNNNNRGAPSNCKQGSQRKGICSFVILLKKFHIDLVEDLLSLISLKT